MQPSEPAGSAELTCYRHPDRRAGVGCQRCGRPICPSCMVTASVGFQCPECAHQGAKQQRLVDVHRRATVPYVTYSLIAINVLVFIVGSIADHQANIGLSGASGTFTSRFGELTPCIGAGQWYRLITGGFLHAGFLHIAFNMWALFVIGRPLEAALGRVRFSVLYAVSLVGGALGVVIVDLLGHGPYAPTVGAWLSVPVLTAVWRRSLRNLAARFEL